MIQIKDVVAFGFHGAYQRAGLYDLEEVLPYIGPHLKDYDGHLIDMESARYRLFDRELVCVTCGVIGSFFAKERSAKKVKVCEKYPEGRKPCLGNDWHFNLYGFRRDGVQVMMTKDHIIPKSKGGPNDQSNYQTMCSPCNGNKRDKMPVGVTKIPLEIGCTGQAGLVEGLRSVEATPPSRTERSKFVQPVQQDPELSMNASSF